MRLLATLLVVAAFVVPASAGAAIVATPMSDPAVAVSQGSPLATLFTNTDGAQVVEFNSNYNTKLTVSDGSVCPLVQIKRGTQRYRCNVPAGGSVFYSTFALASTTYTYAVVGGSIAASVGYLTTPTPFVQTVYMITCNWKGWGFYVAPPGCPVVPS